MVRTVCGRQELASLEQHAVIFDIDGTLLQSAEIDDQLYREAVCSVLGEVRFRDSLHAYSKVTDDGILSEIATDNAISLDSALVGQVRDQFVGLLSGHIERHGPFAEIPGAFSFLEQLTRSPGHRVAMATGGWRASARLKLQSAGFAQNLIPLMTSDDAPTRTGIMHKALDRLGSGITSVTYFGDGPWDQRATAELGWQFVAVGKSLGGLHVYPDRIESVL